MVNVKDLMLQPVSDRNLSKSFSKVLGRLLDNLKLFCPQHRLQLGGGGDTLGVNHQLRSLAPHWTVVQNLLISFLPCMVRRQLECQSFQKMLFTVRQRFGLLYNKVVKFTVLKDWSLVTSRSKTKLHVNYIYFII